ncbi:MAG: beta family protein [Candidatus Eisenbacteria bacterium]
MSFGPDHYVPVLKIKRGEKAALRLLAPSFWPRITPLLEIVERRSERSPDEHLETAFKGLAESVGAYPYFFLDLRELAPDGAAVAAKVFGRAADAGMAFIPVTGISRGADLDAAKAHRSGGLALRLTREEFERGDLATKLNRFMTTHGLAHEETDLIVDLGPVDDMIAPGVMAFAEAFLADVPEHLRWRSFTISSCAFPRGMGGLERHSYDFVDRIDWIAWRDCLLARREDIPRLPTFSDGAIQHPAGVEGFNPAIMQASASVRYTLAEKWLRIKGQGLRTKSGSLQFPSLATRLVYGDLRGHYAGQDHCEGCRLIKLAADGAPKLGSLEAWRRLGTVHHIAVVIQGLGLPPGP